MEEKVMKDCKVLALCSQKGGVGKTTSCVNLAVGLAKAGKKVLVIDNDPQGSMTASLGYHNPDELPITLATILTKIVEDELFENTLDRTMWVSLEKIQRTESLRTFHTGR